MLDRTITPSTRLPESLTLPKVAQRKLRNGMTLYWIDCSPQNDVVRLSVAVNRGTRHQHTPFAASAMLNLLSEGTQNLSSAEVAEKLDFYGIFYDSSVDRDFGLVTVNCLGKFLPETLGLLEECLLRPTFPQHELDIYRNKRREQLLIEREKPSYLAREMFSRNLFGATHPYGFVASADDYDRLTRDHLVEIYDEFFRAENCFAVVSGRVTDESLEAIAELLEKVPVRGAELDRGVVPAGVSTSEAHLERDDAVQTSLRIGRLMVNKSHADFDGLQVVSMILGGYFGSRLVTLLREERGYTYGIYSAMVALEHAGYMAIASDVIAEHATEAIALIKQEIKRLQTELVSQEELQTVKNMILGELMRILDGPFGVCDVVIENIQSGKTPEYLDKFLQKVRTITPQEVKTLAQKYLDFENFSVVSVGKL